MQIDSKLFYNLYQILLDFSKLLLFLVDVVNTHYSEEWKMREQLISESEFSKVLCRVNGTQPEWIYYDKANRTARIIPESTAMRVLDCHAVQTAVEIEKIGQFHATGINATCDRCDNSLGSGYWSIGTHPTIVCPKCYETQAELV